ncbi:MAG: hypothetical protein DCC49_13020 [Acidobacteria bacterium]|nr:MAG: hypothetical protein DCC49_13020 [Acidobacteriota bacterium]
MIKRPGELGTLRIRRLAVFAAMAFLASLFVSGPNQETPAYGLSDAGFIDGIPLYQPDPSMGGAILVDSAANRVLLGTTPGQSFFNPATRRAYFPPVYWEEHLGPSCVFKEIAGRDVDSLQPASANSDVWGQACYDGDVFGVDPVANRIYHYARWGGAGIGTELHVFDATTFSEIGSPAVITDTEPRDEAFDFKSRRVTVVEWPLDRDADRLPLPPASYRVWSVDLDSRTIVKSASFNAGYPCRAVSNPATNRVYVVDEEPGEVIVLDTLDLREVTRIPIAPYLGVTWRSRDLCAVAVNPATNRIYLLRAEGSRRTPPPTGAKLVVIDGESNQVVDEIDVADPNAVSHANIAVDPATSRIFVGVPTPEFPNRVQVFVDATPDTIQNIQQTGRYTQWFFAEGTTRPGFRTFLTLYSPDAPNRVRISYLTGPGQGGPFFQEVDLPANTRITVDAGATTGPDKDISMRIVSLYDKPFFAERPMYFGPSANIGTGGTTGTGQHN